jgi:hypothetical protein
MIHCHHLIFSSVFYKKKFEEEFDKITFGKIEFDEPPIPSKLQENVFWRIDSQHNDIQPSDIQPNDIQPNDTQHQGLISDIEHNDTQHNDTQYNKTLALC